MPFHPVARTLTPLVPESWKVSFISQGNKFVKALLFFVVVVFSFFLLNWNETRILHFIFNKFLGRGKLNGNSSATRGWPKTCNHFLVQKS